MPACPFATPKSIVEPAGDHRQTPYKIVHHTTEGSSADGAFAAFAKNRSAPHFTVDDTEIYQHIDTDVAARALRNKPGGVETNRASAVQIEVVGFAGSNKKAATLRNVARLCRWLEQIHDVPRVWPSGFPKPAGNGADPGGHNRDATNWTTKSGHYGHSQVPENVHWDPAYSKIEVEYLMAAEFDADGHLTNPGDPAVQALAHRAPPFDAAQPVVMDDHADVGEQDDD